MTHHKRCTNVGPAQMSNDLQPASQTGRHASCAAMSCWSMDALSNHRLGVRRYLASNSCAHRSSACHLQVVVP